ncbi:transmembrane 220 family protein [Flagellimonas flava]|uniref:transmembrane 220 family protein n=1 Tax=Flagellimonas flava TaxID=570519 RepID=UPI003D650FC0
MGAPTKSFSPRKIFNLVLFVLFAAFAYVQLNDKDGMLWFSIYGVVALVHLYIVFKTINRIILLLMMIGLAIYSAVHIPYFVDWIQVQNKSELFGEMVYEKPYLEGTREFLGLVIALVSMVYQWRQSKK